MEKFIQGQRLGQTDLLLLCYNRYSSTYPEITLPFTPQWIRYSIGYIHPVTSQFLLIGIRNRIPEIIDVGKIRPNFIIGRRWPLGIYEIRWRIKDFDNSPEYIISVQFEVISDGISQSDYNIWNHFDIAGMFYIV